MTTNEIKINQNILVRKLGGGKYAVSQLIKNTLYEKQSPFQHIVVAEFEDDEDYVSKFLVTDGRMQLGEEEFIYHEQLAIPPLFYHANPKKVLVIGGGDGLALRQVFQDQRVEQAVLCELDEEIIQVSKEYFGQLNQGSLDDPRLKIRLGDCRDTLKTIDQPYDVILIDLMDPDVYEVDDLYQSVFQLLPPLSDQRTIINVFAGDVRAEFNYPIRAMASLNQIFPHVHLHRTYVNDWDQECGFIFASHANYMQETDLDRMKQNSTAFISKVKALRCENFPSAFYLPPYLESQLQAMNP
jgi:spermidine synthase